MKPLIGIWYKFNSSFYYSILYRRPSSDSFHCTFGSLESQGFRHPRAIVAERARAMRFNFDVSETKVDSRRSLTPKEEVEWVPLQNHPVFAAASAGDDDVVPGWQRNLIVWDGSSRIYFWDDEKQWLHRISIRMGEPEPTSVLAATPSKVTPYLKI